MEYQSVVIATTLEGHTFAGVASTTLGRNCISYFYKTHRLESLDATGSWIA